mmetsp:Transcript_18438/g.38595  ORF Transcript_18438/g.38595 Transcript_18438/m.38595 type:complete len:238 (-) Transcript_18438:2836-3549(-)
MLAYRPHNGTTSMLIEYKPSGRKLRWLGLATERRNDASVIKRTNTSTIDHFPRTSSQWRSFPLRLDGNQLGGANQMKRVKSSLVYGHTPEKITINIARTAAPAFHISTVDFAIENSKNPWTSKSCPANVPLMLTVPPKLRCPLKNNAMFPRITTGINSRRHRGTSLLRTKDVILLFKSFSFSLSLFCIISRSSFCLVVRVSTQRLWRRLDAHLVATTMKEAIIAQTAITAMIAIKNS